MKIKTTQASKILPFSLKDAPSFIEHTLPAQQVSIEAQTERKAGAGQTLTALGSYWKGRKPLILVRACVLGALLPATGDPQKDLEIFEKLMAMDDESFEHRAKSVSLQDVETYGGSLRDELLDDQGKWKRMPKEQKQRLLGKVLAKMPYSERLNKRSYRPEELPDSIYANIWHDVNAHLGTNARSHTELVEQLGIMRFGHRPKVADTFCGGGSIPFEAARLGCDVYASDLNPIACMLTWGALNIMGADEETREAIAKAQQEVAEAVDREITELGIEHDEQGNRAKAYLYCLETRCPQTGWMVPLAPSWVISVTHNVYAKLIPNHKSQHFDIKIISGGSSEEMQQAKEGSVRNGHLVYTLNGEEYNTPIKTLRGDRKGNGVNVNDLRRWEKSDFVPRPDDIFQERLYCIQWTCSRYDAKKDKFISWTEFRSITQEDLEWEQKVEKIVRQNLEQWQNQGLVPDMKIEPGYNTDQPIRERGWAYWHHLFNARQLLWLSSVLSVIKKIRSPHIRASLYSFFTATVNRQSKLCQLLSYPGPGREPKLQATFYNQAFNTFYNFGSRAHTYIISVFFGQVNSVPLKNFFEVHTQSVDRFSGKVHICITDPPYADAVHYHEITEFFIAWLRKDPPEPFKDWVWDSRRELAIKGSGEDFRREMVKAYKAMAEQMPDNGLQIVMFTHQDSNVWTDMTTILWGAGLRVTAAWYIATETTSELKKGGYVQGTVILVLRKRLRNEQILKMELVQDIRKEVAQQIETMVGLNQTVKKHGRAENLFEDADLQMAGYAAALRVLTSYSHIDATDMTKETLRPRIRGETTLVDEIIEHAVQIANEYLVPEGLQQKIWEDLSGSERFYLRMLEIEAAGLHKLDNYQNFAKAFKVLSYAPLMASMTANKARLKSAVEFKRSEFSGSEFGGSMLRAILYALYELQQEVDEDEVLSHLRDNMQDYYKRRETIRRISEYIALKLVPLRPEEASAARILTGLVKNELLRG